MTIDIEPLKKQLGRKIEDEDVVTQAPIKAMIATFDRHDKVPDEGEPIAPGWHLSSCIPTRGRRSSGRTAPPSPAACCPRSRCRGACMPARPSPSTATSGSATSSRREIEFSDIQLRTGSTGTLIVTTQTRRIFTPRGLALTEAANTVFREEVKPGEKSGVPVRDAAPADVPWRRTIKPDPVMLFRYSAITFNPHRIHYDRTYCIETEGYPGLVVHGPFAQQCLFDLLRNSDAGPEDQDLCRPRPGAAVRHLAVRRGRPADRRRQRGAELWTVTPKGTIAAQATATLA